MLCSRMTASIANGPPTFPSTLLLLMSQLVSSGIYSTAEAARLIGADPAAVRRWGFGYRRDREYEAVVSTELSKREGHYAVTFVELVELISVREMLDLGLTWPKVRKGLETFRRLLEVEHPFAMKRWFADPAGLFVRLEREQGKDLLIELVGHGQVSMFEPLRQYLNVLEFGPQGLPERWYPAGPEAGIVVDPRVAFGQPVVQGTSTRTAVLYRMHQGGEDIPTIAWAYELDSAEVEAAIQFEASLAA